MKKFLIVILLLPFFLGCNEKLPDQNAFIRKVSDVSATASRNLAKYKDEQSLSAGYLNVTLPPYSADPSGEIDATDAIQQALNDARDARMICYLPSGKYLISNTITGIQGTVERDEWHFEGFVDPLLKYESFEYPNVILGTSSEERAILILKDNAVGFDDPENPKPLIHFWSRMEYGDIDKSLPQPNISFNQKIIGLDIYLGKDNPGAIGIHHQGAEGSVIEDLNIHAEGAFAGIKSAPGSGGGIFGIRISGGEYGFYIRSKEKFKGSQPAPVIAGVRLSGQTKDAILYDGRGPLTLAGADIFGAGIRSDCTNKSKWNGAMNLTDVIIDLKDRDTAIISNHSVVIKNVFIKHAKTAVYVKNVHGFVGNPKTWLHIKRSFIPGVSNSGSWSGNLPVKDDIWINRERTNTPVFVTDNQTPENKKKLLEKHSWPKPFPNGMSLGVVNVKDAPYYAKGDGMSDDAKAIQKAIDENEYIFIPKGTFTISKPLVLKSSTKLFGLGNVQTIITPTSGSNSFSDPDNPLPLIETVDDRDAETVLAFLKLLVPVRNPCVYALNWRAGRNSIVRNVYPIREPSHPHGTSMGYPMLRIEKSGGGKWFTNVLLHWWDQGPTYRHLLIEGTKEPLSFYMLEPQHGRGEYMVEMKNACNVNVYSVKSEGDYGVFLIDSCSNFSIFGYGGNGSPHPEYPIFTIKNSHNYLLANINPQHTAKGHYGALGISGDPAKWFLLKDHYDKKELSIKGTEQFVIYTDLEEK